MSPSAALATYLPDRRLVLEVPGDPFIQLRAEQGAPARVVAAQAKGGLTLVRLRILDGFDLEEAPAVQLLQQLMAGGDKLEPHTPG